MGPLPVKVGFMPCVDLINLAVSGLFFDREFIFPAIVISRIFFKSYISTIRLIFSFIKFI